ncbi:MAG: DNA-3-methyladenine glycosylase I [bacterium]|nr:DNA-3-methyladenine glycosylase I [bacterium]
MTENLGWCFNLREPLYRNYHDLEWGVPVHDDRRLFEFLALELMQCGLNWVTILKKRDIMRSCFEEFDFNRIAEYTEADVERIMAVPGMLRNRGKILAVINNARCFLDIRSEFGSFGDYLWQFTQDHTYVYSRHWQNGLPAQNELSRVVSQNLKRSGFKYTGPVVVYAYLQACGLVNDHMPSCPRYAFINGLARVQEIPGVD